MQQRQVGGSGLWVGRIGLGTLTWGSQTDPIDSADQLEEFLKHGGTLVSTSDAFADGNSERQLGQHLADLKCRDDVVLATSSQTGFVRNADSSRRHLMTALNRSLTRLGVDHVDLWQVQWDPRTPIAETMRVLDDAVAAGKTRYVGLVDFAGWQVAMAATWQSGTSERERIVTNQVEYSLINRTVEAEGVPAAANCDVSMLATSPLAGGILTGKYRSGTPTESRGASPEFGSLVGRRLNDVARRIVDAVCTAAEGLNVTPAEVALAWVRDRPAVAAVVLGAHDISQLRSNLASDTVNLPAEIRAALDDASSMARPMRTDVIELP